jgi:hypothetical protein
MYSECNFNEMHGYWFVLKNFLGAVTRLLILKLICTSDSSILEEAASDANSNHSFITGWFEPLL